jgi:hypothetical protein
MELKDVLERSAIHIEDFERSRSLNGARKAAEAICKIILLSAENEIAREKATENSLSALTDGINVRNTAIKAFHIKRIKIELSTIRDYCNEFSHDNETTLSESDYQRVQAALDSLINFTFDAKDENLIIDEELPEQIYIKINKKKQLPEDWRCEKVISVVYPNRKIQKLLSNRECELYRLYDINKTSVGFVFLKRDISIKKAFTAILEVVSASPPFDTMTFLFPKEVSKSTGNSVKGRKDYIKRSSKAFTSSFPNSKYSFEFIEDYIWDNCLSESMKEPANQSSEPFFIDQKLYSTNGASIFSLDFIDSVTKRKPEHKKPIYLVVGDGGAGKTTFCKEAVSKIDSLLQSGLKKKAILISSFDVPEELKSSESVVGSIQELYQSTLTDHEDQVDYKSLLLNISSGNVLIIIDGLDEIESKLKERFSIDTFITSLVELNDTYNNCTVIITSRPSKRDLSNQEEIEELNLHGFDNELIEKYLAKRFRDDKKRLATSRSYLEQINSEEQATPLILRLISDLVEDDLEQIETDNTDYFIFQNPLDKVVAQIIKREIRKQTLKISIDQYFKILSDIVFDYGNSVSESELNELIEFHFIDSNTEPTEENFKKIKISPLLSNFKGRFGLKHDALILWVKSRELINKVNGNVEENNKGVLRCLNKELYKGGPLVDEIKKYKTNAGGYERRLIAKATKRLGEPGLSSLEKSSERKIISAAIRLNLPESNSEKSTLTEELKRLFGCGTDDLKYLSLYGDFLPLDFAGQKFFSAHFEDYRSFAKCKFSADTVFYSSTFIKTDTSALSKSAISPSNFVNCNLCENLERHLSTQTENLEKKTENIKNDLIKILKTGYRSNCFNWKSEKVYRQQCASLNIKIGLQRILEKLCNLEILLKESEKSSSEIGYRVAPLKSHSVAKLITDDIVDKEIRTVISEFVDL